MLIPALSSCRKADDGDKIKALTVTVSPETKSVLRGETFTVTATVLPANLPDRSVVWSSFNPEMASVDKDGLVKTIRPGVTYIVATSADGKAKGACQLTINYPDKYYIVMQDAEGNDLPAVIYGYPTMTRQLSAQSSDDVKHSFSWFSSNEAAASVSASGLVTYAAPTAGRNGYLYYDSTTLKVESEDTFSDKVTAVSNIRAAYSFGGGVRDFDEDYGVSGNKRYSVYMLWYNGKDDMPLPASLYTIESSDQSAFKVEKDGDVYKVTSAAEIGQSARLTVKLQDGKEIVLGRYTVSDTVSGDISDYVEDIR